MSFDWHGESASQWNRMSKHWQQNSKEMWEEGSRIKIIPLFIKHLSLDSGTILDAGCGDGYGTRKMARLGYHMIGIDISKDMIEEAKSQQGHLPIQFIQADVVSLPFQDDSFDGVLSINCLEWIQSPLTGLRELKRVLKPGGRLCLGILGPTAAPRQHSYKRLYGEEVICNTMMPWECARLLEENGFRILDQEGVYKKGVQEGQLGSLSLELKQALTFMWLFIVEKQPT
ncbi:class I SAM-dependent methyltransferase [Ammoniphilus sp. CFH 90114]|uniref:class I SAM-dependent methyltransferase n=1 Tax=Ammoniphilus sp. CFH 90114 TaxID=2493665 RepID=UPI00100FD9DD|nr:class I SAM-dependent methyltransferase [Ammoniphilus sp. CFH 90114]RXT05850.1 class I SAM-dependent methyltransferase [Ammoniphilus sp. CFH 90114]